MSSFRPTNSAKLYASPEDAKTVGYRSRSLPGHSARPHVRKSHSLRASNNSTFKPPSQCGGQPAGNQYAQPLKTGRSHGILGPAGRKKKPNVQTSSSTTNLAAPPIPEPDYSLSESENDETDGESEIAKELEKAAARDKLESAKETSGNSNTSGSSSGSSSIPHSFSVDEIQKVRTRLKSSKSYPNDFLLQQTQQLMEDGDNSSSGVSSDQDVPVGPPTGFDDSRNENNAHTGTPAAPDKENNPKRMSYSSGMLTRHAVSLAQLPPPMEADAEEQGSDLFVPPPPEFTAGPSTGNGDELVFAPPPQFCDNRQQSRVRIVGAIPKVGINQVKPPSGRLHSQ